MSTYRLTTSIVATVSLLGAIFSSSPVDAQQRQQQGGGRGGSTQGTTGLGRGTGMSGGSTSGTTSGTTGGSGTGVQVQSGSSRTGTGQAAPQPMLREFGEVPSQATQGPFGRGAGDVFQGQLLGGPQSVLGGRSPLGGTQFGGSPFGGSQFGGLGTGRQSATTRGAGTTGRTRAEQLRPQHRVSFSFAPASNAAVSSSLRTQMRPLQSQGRIRGVQFDLDGDGTLTLRGTAATAEDRELAAAVARLEPGVRRIDNQIVVPEVSPTPATSPAGLP